MREKLFSAVNEIVYPCHPGRLVPSGFNGESGVIEAPSLGDRASRLGRAVTPDRGRREARWQNLLSELPNGDPVVVVLRCLGLPRHRRRDDELRLILRDKAGVKRAARDLRERFRDLPPDRKSDTDASRCAELQQLSPRDHDLAPPFSLLACSLLSPVSATSLILQVTSLSGPKHPGGHSMAVKSGPITGWEVHGSSLGTVSARATIRILMASHVPRCPAINRTFGLAPSCLDSER